MAKFRRGTDAAAAPKATRGGGFVRNISWKDGDKKYVQFVRPSEDTDEALTLADTIAVLTHDFIRVGFRVDKDGRQVKDKYRMERFVSRRDPALDGPDGYDPIWDGWGEYPVEKTYAVFIELEPTFKPEKGRKKLVSVEPKMRSFTNREGETVTVPEISVACQSWSNFYAPLETLQEDRDLDLDGTVFAVVRKGGGTDTVYTWLDQNVEPVNLDEHKDHWINLEAYIDGLADKARMEELVGPLDPATWPITEYPKKKRGEAASNEGRGKTKSDETSPPWKEEEPAEEPDAFEALKAEVG